MRGFGVVALILALTACGARSSLDIPGQAADGGTAEDVTQHERSLAVDEA